MSETIEVAVVGKFGDEQNDRGFARANRIADRIEEMGFRLKETLPNLIETEIVKVDELEDDYGERLGDIEKEFGVTVQTTCYDTM